MASDERPKSTGVNGQIRNVSFSGLLEEGQRQRRKLKFLALPPPEGFWLARGWSRFERGLAGEDRTVAYLSGHE